MVPGQSNLTTMNLPVLKKFGNSNGGVEIYVSDKMDGYLSSLKLLSEDKTAGHSAYHAKTLLGSVNMLRGNASPNNSLVDKTNPRRRRMVYSGFEIEYEINRNGFDSVGIEILNIRITKGEAQDAERAGLWSVAYNKDTDTWKADSWQPTLAAHKNAGTTKENPIKIGINGYCGGLEHAANLLPSHIVKGDEAKLGKLQQVGYTLFYVPVAGNTLKAGAQFVKQLSQVRNDGNDIEPAQILASHMLEAHNQGLYVDWTSHRGGSFVLTEAMKVLTKMVDGKGRFLDLDKRQKIMLSDNTSGHFYADELRRKLNMDVTDKKWVNATPGAAQLIGGSQFGIDDAAISINELFKYTPKDKRLMKGIDTAQNVGDFVKGKWAFGGTLAALMVTAHLPAAFAAALARTAFYSIPGLNENYYGGALQPVKNIVQKLTKKG